MRTLTEEKRQAIIDAAAQLFQETGYERASMNEVAKRAGGSKATLYNYFPSKEALFETVVRTYSTRFLTEAAAELDVPEDGQRSLENKLTRFGEKMMHVLTGGNPALQIYRIVVGEAGHSDIGALFQGSGPKESMARLADLMADAMKTGELAPSDPMLRAMQFTSLVKAEADAVLLQRELPDYSTARINDMVRNGVQLFLHGASPQAGK
ncbi:TetR/AcrR family transcriptional regulator [Dickeya solani]|uniref:TetR/AcrR family transcriptional regulator n=2 Tax=Dickeya solani TaxID=1089444 RepID=A0ABU4EAR2_9GAMM|nr:TetR/AcrR family transcriptional regulator [Dickeya solani]ANE77373.1 TetR family transcriptional regulator [Dickeya solani IPO 2222]AUC40659.1 TetR-family transcriptional regulator [Dickeya solani RNS 08.23.3.1.A]AUH07218.1 TetR family transcriptional regulator [Dickeya solani D s0432-1]AUH11265.1 TetR family transcriptional regulator [Dickeya solani]AYQ47967.1 A-factor receptor protein [Dickeya solani]